MGIKKIVVLVLIVGIVISIQIITSADKDKDRKDHVVNFEKEYLPKKAKECLKKHGYSVETPTAAEQKECEDYVKQIWYEQKILNGIEE